jgi:uncharacterized membrane protein YuzA (DUF378 family)
MRHLAAALAVSTFSMVLCWFYLKPVRIPLLTYLIAYSVTTVIGAAALLDDAGLREFKIHQPMFRPEDYPLIGSMTYWLLLLAPFFLVPVGAAVGLRAADVKLLDRSAAVVASKEPSLVPIVYSIAGVCAVYCLWKLISSGAYFPDLYFDRSLPCNVRLVRRTELFTVLRYLYYAFAYAVIPIGATVALLSWKDSGRHFHAATFALLFAAVLYFNVVLYMKANLVVAFLTLVFGCIVAKASFRFFVVLGVATVACLLLMQGLIGCYRDPSQDAWRSRMPTVLASAEPASLREHVKWSGDVGTSAVVAIAGSQATQLQTSSGQGIVDAAVVFVRSAVFRMAASMPYYVQIFSNPGERCGLESNSLPFLPREACYPATKVGTHVNPGEIQAFQSAPAHVNAYAELGLEYAFIVLLLGGSIMGFCWGISRKVQSPLFWSAGAAVCVFSYYLTQAGLVGALTHSYGFVWYLFPILVAVAIHAFARNTISHFAPKMNARTK